MAKVKNLVSRIRSHGKMKERKKWEKKKNWLRRLVHGIGATLVTNFK